MNPFLALLVLGSSATTPLFAQQAPQLLAESCTILSAPPLARVRPSGA